MTTPASPAGSTPDLPAPTAPASAPDTPAPSPRPTRPVLVWVVGGLAALGLLQAGLWAVLAPGQQFAVYTNGGYLTLPTADSAPFTSVAIYVLMALLVGVVAAAVGWQVRTARGLPMLLTLLAGAAVGCVIAYFIGPLFTGGVDPASVGPVKGATDVVVQQIVTAPPQIGPLVVLVAEPLAVAVIYTILAAWHGERALGNSRVAA